jgi:hypothetical protein
MPWKDPAVRREHLRSKYANDDEYRARTRENINRWKREVYRQSVEVRAAEADKQRTRSAARRAYVDQIKVERGCADCGYNANPIALDFDHVRGDKVCDVSKAKLRSMALLVDEIAKCEVVCANCHRIRTDERR